MHTIVLTCNTILWMDPFACKICNKVMITQQGKFMYTAHLKSYWIHVLLIVYKHIMYTHTFQLTLKCFQQVWILTAFWDIYRGCTVYHMISEIHIKQLTGAETGLWTHMHINVDVSISNTTLKRCICMLKCNQLMVTQ